MRAIILMVGLGYALGWCVLSTYLQSPLLSDVYQLARVMRSVSPAGVHDEVFLHPSHHALALNHFAQRRIPFPHVAGVAGVDGRGL